VEASEASISTPGPGGKARAFFDPGEEVLGRKALKAAADLASRSGFLIFVCDFQPARIKTQTHPVCGRSGIDVGLCEKHCERRG
jgi:hypothetical protein